MSEPNIQKIPISKLMPNPKQPRRRFKPGSIQRMANTLKANDQLTPLKVRLLTPEERVLYPPFEYMVIGGHRRLAGAKLAGFETLNCIVLDLPPSQTHFASLMDNDLDEMDWWEWDLAIWEEKLDNPGLSVRDLAGRLDKSKSKVQYALKILAALTPTAQEMVSRNLEENEESEPEEDPETEITQKTLKKSVRSTDTKNKGFLITELHLVALADLKDPALVERALKVVLEDYLTLSQVRELVAAVKTGTQPEDYHGEAPAPRSKKAAMEPALATGAAEPTLAKETGPADPTLKKGVGFEGTQGPSPVSSSGRGDLVQKGGSPSEQAPSHLGDTLPAGIAWAVLWKKVQHMLRPAALRPQAEGQALRVPGSGTELATSQKVPGSRTLERFFHKFAWFFNLIRGWFERLGVKNKSWANLITIILILWAGSFLISHASRLLTRVVRYVFYSSQVVSPSVSAPVSQLVPQSSTSAGGSSPAQTLPSKLSDDGFVGTQGGSPVSLLKPSGNLAGRSQNFKKKTHPVTAIPRVAKAGTAVVVPSKLKHRVEDDSSTARFFAMAFYSPDYRDLNTWFDILKSNLVDGLYDEFMGHFYPPAKIGELKDQKLICYFDPKDPPKLLSLNGNRDSFLVEGIVTIKSDLRRTKEVIATEPASLEIGVSHPVPMEARVYSVKVVHAPGGTGTAQGDDLGKMIGDTLKVIPNAVSTVNEGVNTVDKAKKALGL